jgi:hypothetical protein
LRGRTSNTALGLSILVVVFAAAAPGPLDAPDLLAHRIAAALTAGAAMLALAVVVVVALIVRPGHAAPPVRPTTSSEGTMRIGVLGSFLYEKTAE